MLGNDGTHGAITFDRPEPGTSYVEFRDIGNSNTHPPNSGVMQDYYSVIGYNLAGAHNEFYNGDEIHIQFELTCFGTTVSSVNGSLINSGSHAYTGYNYIIPKIELYDGSTLVPSSKLATPSYTTYGGSNPYSDMQTTPSDMGSDFQDDYFLLNGTSVYYFGSVASQHSDYSFVPYRTFSSSGSVTFPVEATYTVIRVDGATAQTNANCSTKGFRYFIIYRAAS